MHETPRILLADDEPIFLSATADLLRREGLDCVTVGDGDSALTELGQQEFDLLITDLEMPGNTDLAVIRRVADRGDSLPVIVLTGYPSVRSAMACIELPVAAYLTKPVDFQVLLAKTRMAVSRFRSYRTMHQAETRLQTWRDEFNHLQAAAPKGGSPIDVFLTLTLRNVMGSLTDLEQLSRALNNQEVTDNPCQLMNCPRGTQLQAAVEEAVQVLEETRGAFKSKQLGDLRHKLELLLKHV
ncbi:MAG: response regulator [Gemmatimonadales bacterium]